MTFLGLAGVAVEVFVVVDNDAADCVEVVVVADENPVDEGDVVVVAGMDLVGEVSSEDIPPSLKRSLSAIR